MPIVLTSNEKILSGHSWKDLEGEHYHFPNQYRTKITAGTTFVYYRGVHRLNGRAGEMEYFGTGKIGDVWLDPDTADETPGRRNWYCSIEDYVPFPSPVLARLNGETIETVVHPHNHWRTAVRNLTDDQLDLVLSRAGLLAALEAVQTKKDELLQSIAASAQPELGQVSKHKPPVGVSGGGSSSGGYSRESKSTGDAGEQAVLKYLESVPGVSEIRWVASHGETPGWDIQYKRADGTPIYVEVKSSQSKAISAIEITANEWRAAKEHRGNYHLALVGSCLSLKPVIQFVEDPFGEVEKQALTLASTRFSLNW